MSEEENKVKKRERRMRERVREPPDLLIEWTESDEHVCEWMDDQENEREKVSLNKRGNDREKGEGKEKESRPDSFILRRLDKGAKTNQKKTEEESEEEEEKNAMKNMDNIQRKK